MMRGKAGYSLLEVLIAFAIMTLVLSALLPGQTRLLQRVQSADEQTLATDFAISLADLASVTPTGEWRDTNYAYRDWHVEQRVRNDSDGQQNLLIRILSLAYEELTALEVRSHSE